MIGGGGGGGVLTAAGCGMRSDRAAGQNEWEREERAIDNLPLLTGGGGGALTAAGCGIRPLRVAIQTGGPPETPRLIFFGARPHARSNISALLSVTHPPTRVVTPSIFLNFMAACPPIDNYGTLQFEAAAEIVTVGKDYKGVRSPASRRSGATGGVPSMHEWRGWPRVAPGRNRRSIG